MIRRVAPAAALVLVLAGLSACAGGGGAPSTAAGACKLNPSPNVLLSLARCCAESLSSNPSCREYNAERGFVIVKDNARDKPRAYLIIPVRPVTGIEDPQVLRSPIADLWQYGWEESTRFLQVPSRRVALAVNSMAGRTDNQLHIHISCVRPDVEQVLERNRQLSYDASQPREVRLRPYNHLYRVVLARDLIRHASPFDVVSQMPGAIDSMGRQSIAVIASRVPEEYYVLDTV